MVRRGVDFFSIWLFLHEKRGLEVPNFVNLIIHYEHSENQKYLVFTGAGTVGLSNVSKSEVPRKSRHQVCGELT